MNSLFNKTSFLIIFITLAIIGSISYFFILPTYNNYNSIKQQIRSDQQTYDDSQRTLRTYQKLDSQKEEINKYSEKTSNLVPKDPELEDYIIDLEGMISQSPIPSSEFSLASLTSSAEANSPSVVQNLNSYQITINGESNITNIFTLINQFLSMSRLTEITALSLTNDDKGALSFDLTGNIFSNPKSTATEIKNPSRILSEAASKITQYETHSLPIEIQTEDGFGRTNPFAGY